ncbi:MAG: hypothetical protein HC817_08665, partial [Saprospiraceae bacterium]|nr:hypothetical protein [Saprospiraceae bacterium]
MTSFTEEARTNRALEYWQHFNYEQMARFGVSRGLYFSLGGPYETFNQVDYQLNYRPRPSYRTMVEALQPRPLSTLNGSFSAPEDKYSNWIIHFRPGSADFLNGEFKEWAQTSFRQDGRYRAPNTTDDGYLQMNKGRAKMARRVIDGLSPRPYRATAWVYQNGGTASLRVYGFDQDEGDLYVEETATS